MSKNILIIDDDRELSKTLCHFLEKKGYSVKVATNEVQGQKLFDLKKPDLLLLDIILNSKPRGLTLLSKIKSDKAHTELPVIIMTKSKHTLGMNIQNAIEDERFNPNVALVVKPFKNDFLIDEINKKLK